LPGGQAFVPTAGVGQREEGAADAGQRAAGGRGEQADGVDVEAEGAGGVGAVADDAHAQADAGGTEEPVQGGGCGEPEEEQRADFEGAADLRQARPEAEGQGWQVQRFRLHIGFAEEEGDAGSGEHDGDAHGDVVHAGQ